LAINPHATQVHNQPMITSTPDIQQRIGAPETPYSA
jgi:hypothetical protein